MRHAVLLLACTFLLTTMLPISLPAEGIVLGYVTGKTYRALDDGARMGWLVGVMDGIMAEDFTINSPSKGSWLGKCVEELDKEQLKAIFEKELQAKPEAWHAPAALIFRATLSRFCGA